MSDDIPSIPNSFTAQWYPLALVDLPKRKTPVSPFTGVFSCANILVRLGIDSQVTVK